MSQFYIVPKPDMDNIEAAIQRKRGESRSYAPEDMAAAISTIPSSVDGTDLPAGGIYLTKPDANGNPTEAHINNWSTYTPWTWPNILSQAYFPFIERVFFENDKNVLRIGERAFDGSSLLQSVTIQSNSITHIMNYAFHLCTALTEFAFPNSLLFIGTRAFEDCAIRTVILPHGVTQIDGLAFYGCKIENLTLPNTLAFIGSDAFRNCSLLENVSLENGFNCSINLSYSTKYSAETIVSWLNALADRTGETAYTLTIGATNLAKLTAEQIAIATAKNWTLA